MNHRETDSSRLEP